MRNVHNVLIADKLKMIYLKAIIKVYRREIIWD